MDKAILVTGGTGNLGQLLVTELRDGGHQVRVLTRKPRAGVDGVEYVAGDLSTGEGVAAAVAGVDTVVHCASAPKGDADTTRTLVRAAEREGVKHIVFISVVGVDRVAFGYFKNKLAAEEVVRSSSVPWTMLRATQFYDMIYDGARRLAMLPVVPVPRGFPVEPVAAADVAARLAELAVSPPAGRVPDLTGPHRTSFAEIVRELLRAQGKKRPVVQIWLPGLARINAGALLAPEPAEAGAPQRAPQSWEDYLGVRSAH